MTAVFPDGPGGSLLAEFGQKFAGNLGLVAHEFPLETRDYSLQPEEVTKLRAGFGSDGTLRAAFGLDGICVKGISDGLWPIPHLERRVAFDLYYNGPRDGCTHVNKFCELASKAGQVAVTAGLFEPLPPGLIELWCLLIHDRLQRTGTRIDNHVCYRPFQASIQLIRELGSQLRALQNGAQAVADDYLTTAELAQLAKVERDTFNKRVSECRKPSHQGIRPPDAIRGGNRLGSYSYAAIRLWMCEQWPDKAFLFPESINEAKQFLSAAAAAKVSREG